MAADPLEAKINKIRQQNEEIRRRYEEVEADKQNAAKSNALVQMVPSTDWPERKEPPEFSSLPVKTTPKPRNSPRDHNGSSIQYRPGAEGKKIHTFSQSEGPPPDPKYNFLADSEREEHYDSFSRDVDKNKLRGKPSRPHFKRRGGGREWQSKEYRGKSGASGQDSVPDYEAWRAERNKIDEARISRQRTAEGNWKREWDNDKMHLADDARRENHTLGDAMRYECSEGDRHPRGYPRGSAYSHIRESDHNRRIITSTHKNSQVISNISRNPLMSVKVSSTNIGGTGRVGPRQRSRVMYCSQSEGESMNFEVGNFTVQKSPEEKSKSNNFGNSTKLFTKNYHPQRRNDSDKSPHALRNDKFYERSEADVKSHSFNAKDFRNFQKSPKIQRRNTYQVESLRDSQKFEGKDGYEDISSNNEATSSIMNELSTENIGKSVEIVKNSISEKIESKIIESENSGDYESFESSGDQVNNEIDTSGDLERIPDDENEIKIESHEERGINSLDPINVIDKTIIIDDINTSGTTSSPEVEGNDEDSKK